MAGNLVEGALESARSFLEELIDAVSQADYAYEEQNDNKAFLRFGKKAAEWKYDGTFASLRDELDAALRARLAELEAGHAGTVVVVKAEIKEYTPAGSETVMIWVNDRDESKDGYCIECVPRHVAPTILAALAPTPPATPVQPTASVEAVAGLLEWTNHEQPSWYAVGPVTRKGYIIDREDGKWWACWNVDLPGFDDLDDAKAAAQTHYEQSIRPDPARETLGLDTCSACGGAGEHIDGCMCRSCGGGGRVRASLTPAPTPSGME